MAGHKIHHTESWWELVCPAHITRCTAHIKSTGNRCRREALAGTNVCRMHGATAPHVQAAAAVGIKMSLDEAAKRLVAMIEDPTVDARDRIKVLIDILDRGGLGATSKHLVGVGTVDAVDQLLMDLLGTPGMLEEPTPLALPAPDPVQAAIDAREGGLSYDDLIGGRAVRTAEEIVDAVVVDEHTVWAAGPATAPMPRHIREAFEDLL
jgi:hypothetical protein